jgi:TRAP-type C4-dicarboxylate transport system permease small subunit
MKPDVNVTLQDDAEPVKPARRGARTLFAMLVLVSAAATFSYLSAYAVSDALVSADVMKRWPDGSDPRPRNMACVFAGVLTFFVAVGVIARTLTGRQLRQIDAMSDAEVLS